MGTVGTVIAVLSSSNDFALNLAGCAVLWSMSILEENKGKIVSDGLDILSKLLQTRNEDLCVEVLGCLMNIATVGIVVDGSNGR